MLQPSQPAVCARHNWHSDAFCLACSMALLLLADPKLLPALPLVVDYVTSSCLSDPGAHLFWAGSKTLLDGFHPDKQIMSDCT